MNQSVYKRTKKITYYSLQDNKTVDIVIIGGGLTGLTLAYFLKDTDYKVILLEAQTLGSGASSHNTGKVTFMHGTLLSQIKDMYNEVVASLYYHANIEAMKGIEDIIKKNKIECDYQTITHYLYTQSSSQTLTIEKEKQLYKSFDIETIDQPLAHSIASVGVANQAIFNPLAYMEGLIQQCDEKIDFYEYSRVTEVDSSRYGYKVSVNGKDVYAHKVVYACRYPFFYRHLLFMLLKQSHDPMQYIEAQPSSYALLSIDQPSYSYRPYLSGAIELGKKNKWFNQDTMSLRLLPYIGRLKNDEYIAFGYNKWGNTLSYVAAQLIYDLINDNDNLYKDIFSIDYMNYQDSKDHLHSYWLSSTKQLIKGYFLNDYDLKKLGKDEGVVCYHKGKPTAIYKDPHGRIYMFSAICPHLKCIIQYDKKSHCFECPCHLSHFDLYGHIINGPAVQPLKQRKER